MVLHFFRYLTVIFWIVLSRTVFALDVQINDREINEVLPWLANEAGERLVMSTDISGRLSLVLYDTSWREFLQIVSEKQGLEFMLSTKVLKADKKSNNQRI